MNKLLKFGAVWCSPCKSMDPLLDEITQMEVVKYDIDNEPELVNKYAIRGVPLLVVESPDGELLAMRQGGINRQQLQEFIRQNA